MSSGFERTLRRYDYQFPKSAIGTVPASPRDSAKLLVYNKKMKKTTIDTFLNLSRYLPKRAVIVMNDTKVIPARFFVTKSTGGKVALLYIKMKGDCLVVLSEKRLTVGDRVQVGATRYFTVLKKEENHYFLKPQFKLNNIYTFLNKYGKTPLPPYLKHSPLLESQRSDLYQSVIAREKGSIAAPTASLHFTKRLITNLKKAGHEICFVTLHVGLGTFAPLEEHQLKNKILHEEHYSISAKTANSINKAKKEGRPIIAVGTTVVRALESSANKQKMLKASTGTTHLFIQEGYDFKIVDGIITNFHVPRSSLLMLVSAFVKRTILLKLYAYALKHNFKLFSFGDGMMIV